MGSLYSRGNAGRKESRLSAPALYRRAHPRYPPFVPEDYAADFIRELLKGRPLTEIELIELGERDIGETYVYIRLRGGDDLRLACTPDEAPELLARVKGWRAAPATFPARALPSLRPWAVPLGWAAFAVLSLAAAWRGFDFWLVEGLAGVDHLPIGLIAALAVFTLFWLTVSHNPLRTRYYLMAFPLIYALALVFVSAGKSLNAGLSTPRTISVCGRIISVEDASFTAYFNRGKGRGTSAVPISMLRILVKDDRAGAVHRIDVPGRVAEREGLDVGKTWTDRFYEGAFGWRYRVLRGGGWEAQEFQPAVSSSPCPAGAPPT